MCLNWSKKSQKLLKQQVHDLWICLTCHVWTELLLRHYYQQSTITCCYFAVWDDESETIPWKINMVFPSELFFLCYPSSKRAGHCSLTLSTAARTKYVPVSTLMMLVAGSNLWLSITEALIGNSFAELLVTPVVDVILALALFVRQIGNRIICSFCGLP